jgi:hypothetical protein
VSVEINSESLNHNGYGANQKVKEKQKIKIMNEMINNKLKLDCGVRVRGKFYL